MTSRRSLAVLLAASALVACGDGDSTDGRDGRASDSGVLGASVDGGDASDASAPKPDAGDAATSADFTGEATYYDANGTGACGFPASNDFMIAAINDEQYSKANCGKCVAVTGPNGTVAVRIVDKCPGCGFGDLDLSQTAFSKIAKPSAGRVKITWHFVTCP